MRLKFKMNKALLFFIAVLGVFIFAKNVFAYDLTLTSVGSVSTLGTDYSLIEYTGGIPTLKGTASPSAEVAVKIDTVLSQTIASTSGEWEFVPTSLNQGDNAVVLTSGLQTVSFVIRFNSTASGEVVTPLNLPDESSLPDAGVWEYYLIPIIGGLGVFVLGVFGKKKMHKWENGD